MEMALRWCQHHLRLRVAILTISPSLLQLCRQSPQHAPSAQPGCRLWQHHAIGIALSRLRPPLPHSRSAARSALQRPPRRAAPLLLPCHSHPPTRFPASAPCCHSQQHDDQCHIVRLLCSCCSQCCGHCQLWRGRCSARAHHITRPVVLTTCYITISVVPISR